MKIELKGITLSAEDFEKDLKNKSLLPVCNGVAIPRPENITDEWIQILNDTLSFYALDIATFTYNRPLIYSHKTAFLHEPDQKGFIYAYASRGENFELNTQLIDAVSRLSDKSSKIKKLMLQTFRHELFSTFLLKNCSYVPTNPEFQSHPFAPLIHDSNIISKFVSETQPIRITYPHRVLLDAFGNYSTHPERIMSDKLELALALGFKSNSSQCELFFSELDSIVSPEGDSEKHSALMQYLRNFSDKNKGIEAEKLLSAAHLRLPTIFRERPFGRFGTIGAVSGLLSTPDTSNRIPTRYSIAHRGKHLALVDVIPTLPKKSLNAYARQMQGAPSRYQYLIIKSKQYGEKILPNLPVITFEKELPIDISQYLPETKAFTMLDQKHRLYRKSHLLGGFFINPVTDDLPYNSKNTQRIVDETNKLASENPVEMLYPDLFQLDIDSIVKASLSSELLEALRFFRDRNALHEAYSVKSKAPSLPGAQSKMPVALESLNGEVQIKPSDAFDDQRFTHILKLPVDLNNSSDDKEKAGLCALEYLGMVTAKKLGLEVPRFGVVSWPSLIKELDIGSPKGDLSKEPAYLIERFDITPDPNKSYILKEFQALMGESDKFKDAQGKPHSAESVCLSLKKHSTDFESDKFKLLRFLIVNEIIGNTDMHLKNIAMLEFRDHEKNLISCRLSPSYDIASVDALNPVFFLNSNDPAHAKGLTYNGKVRPTVADWVKIAETCLDITGEQCLLMIDDISQRASQFINTYGDRYISEIFTKSHLLKLQYERAFRRLSLGVNILNDRSCNRDSDSTPYDEFKSVWKKSYEEAQREDAQHKIQNQAVKPKQGGETLNRSVLLGDQLLAALMLPENSGEQLDGKRYVPGGTNQVMISDAIQQNLIEHEKANTFPDLDDLPDFLRG
jgi:hypothetical protein